jgi:hypothetical protein
MFATGRRAFSIGCISLIAVAGLHTLGHFAPPSQDPASLALDAALKGYTFAMPLMSPTAFAVLQSLSLTMTVTFLALGAVGLVAARSSAAAAVRRLAVVYALAVAGLVVVYGVYRVGPPFMTLLPVLAAFVIALRTPRAASR